MKLGEQTIACTGPHERINSRTPSSRCVPEVTSVRAFEVEVAVVELDSVRRNQLKVSPDHFYLIYIY